ncbi:MAG TPA: response regulator [Tepidisphaeraceae bacterium]|jgi:signal transduction histidine kinase|nr:response regulator [Tepidisphaeraceae bacterium]
MLRAEVGIRLRVLVIGSAVDYRCVTEIARTMESFGLFLDHAKTVEESARLVGEHLYDLFLLNGGPGVAAEFIGGLRGRGILSPVILLTDSSEAQAAVESMKAGAADCLIRTELTPQGLVKAITSAVESAEEERGRREMDAALRANENRLWRLIEKNADGMILVDQSGRIRFINPAAEEMFSRPANELMGQPFGYPVVAGETTQIDIVRSDGQTIAAEMRVVELSWEGGPAHLATLRDITQRRKLEEQLRQAQKMEAVGRLAGGIAHDFNNLLTAITGYTELLLARLDGQEPLRRDVEEIRSAAARAASLTNQLLTFSRKTIVQPGILDVNAVVNEMEKLLRRIIGEDIELVTVTRPGAGCVHSDRGHIEQVIMNLAVNARDAMPRGGKLTIETGDSEFFRDPHFPDPPAGRYVVLSFSDTGVGMDHETQARIFEPFFTTKEPGKGTGLGLTIVYGILQQCGGHVRLSSEPEKGTTFQMFFPRLQSAAPAQDGAATAAAPPARGQETILLVEDQDMVRSLVRRILASEGYSVIEACNGQEALELSGRSEGNIDLLLTDVVMPQMSGRELADRFRHDRPETKVIYVSGFTRDEFLKQDAENASAHFLQKPFTPDLLIRKVREVLEAGVVG